MPFDTRTAASALLRAGVLPLLLAAPVAALPMGSKLALSGYIQNQTGVFTERSSAGRDDKGTISMQRNTLWLEGDWKPATPVSFHAILRPVISGSLRSDRDAILPVDEPTNNPRRYMQRKYYTTLTFRQMLREAFVDWAPHELVSLRAGRQQVAWGETGDLRMLDVINPVDNSWHFSGVENFEDVRMPMWILKPLIQIPRANASVEMVWVPALDRRDDYYNIDAPLEAAWQVHNSPYDPPPTDPYSNYQLRVIDQKPGENVKDSRYGFRWKGSWDKLTYTAVYYRTHMLDAAIPERLDSRAFVAAALAGATAPVDYYAIRPRNTIYGGSLEYPFDFPVATLTRLEYVYEPHRTYSPHSSRFIQSNFDNSLGVPVPLDVDLNPMKKETHGVALVLERQTRIPFLMSRESFYIQAQLFERYIPKFRPTEKLLAVPGYDDALLTRWSTVATLAISGKYCWGMVLPTVFAAYDPEGSGFGGGSLALAPGNHFRFLIGYNAFWGHHPFKSIGFYRDRDEAYLQSRILF